MPDERPATCSTCRFWGPLGECRRHAPLAGRQVNPVGWWPVTVAEDWCGEWRPPPARRVPAPSEKE